MSSSPVFYSLVNDSSQWNQTARQLLEKIVAANQIKLPAELPLKIHTGEPGNISFIQPKYMDGMIDYLESQQVQGVFMETAMANGQRTNAQQHRQIAQDHGFTRLPFVLADGENGDDQDLVTIKNGKHFTECKIASQLNQHNQVLVISHFKGHGMTGFGGAIKMLGIGFASMIGKTEAHAKHQIPVGELIDWDKAVLDGDWEAEHIKWNDDYVYHDVEFMERVAEYALAAQKPGHMHIVFATNLVKDCDCDGVAMQPLYPDLGIFASLDPVAIDKAILDKLDQREGKSTYWGREILTYGEKIGLGQQDYQLVEV
jgi:uncharacterized Fe-S center protein